MVRNILPTLQLAYDMLVLSTSNITEPACMLRNSQINYTMVFHIKHVNENIFWTCLTALNLPLICLFMAKELCPKYSGITIMVPASSHHCHNIY